MMIMESAFYIVKCEKCGAEKKVFSHSTTLIKCDECGEPLAHPAGGEAIITGKIVKKLG